MCGLAQELKAPTDPPNSPFSQLSTPANMASTKFGLTFLLLLVLVLYASPVAAFGAGNIASISAVEGRNWRKISFLIYFGGDTDSLQDMAISRTCSRTWRSYAARSSPLQ